MQGDLSALIERVENATGPDRELDALIFRVLDLKLPDQFLSMGIKLSWQADGSATVPVGDMQVRYEPPHFTSSLDAALALVEEILPGTFWHVAKGRTRPDEPLFGAELVSPEHGGVNVAVEHESSVALALILALLRALSARDQQDGGGA